MYEMASISIAEISKTIRQRRSVYPDQFRDGPIPNEIINEMLENANWAPNHKKTEPWRFRVFKGAALERLSSYLGRYYKENTPPEKYSEKKYEKTIQKPLKSGCVIAICMQRDEQERLPEWEEIAAVSCAVQNLWLTCATYDIGGYWSSPKSITQAKDLLQLGPKEKCLGLFYMGFLKDATETPRERKPIADKVIWFDK